MSLTIRLSIKGKKHQKTYRLVVANTRSRREGKPLETIGFYNPLKKPPLINVDMTRFKFWQEKGAIVSERVNKIIAKQK